MAKKKNKLSQIKQSGKYKSFVTWKKQHKLLFWLTIVVFLFGIYQGYRQVNIVYERNQFKTGEKVVSELINQLKSELGGTNIDIYRQCSYGTTKLQKQNLGCAFNYSISYEVGSPEEATKLAKRADKIINENTNLNITSDYSEIDFHDKTGEQSRVESQDSIYSINIENVEFLKCGASLAYGKKNEPIIKRSAGISIKCSSKENVTTNYYPMVN